MIILKYALIYISIILGSSSIAIMLKKKIESCIILDMFIKMIVLYIFGLLGILEIGVYVVLYLPIIFGIILLIKNIKNGDIKSHILTPGMIFFTILYFVFIITTYTKVSNKWDEYSYWSYASKSMFYYNKLFPKITQIHSEVVYPPIPTIWQYFFTRTLNTYSQGIELFATQILTFATLLPLFEKVKQGSKKLQKVCIAILIICIPCIFKGMDFYEVIYVDALLGAVIGYILYQLYNEDNKKNLYITLILSFIILTLIKSTGVVLAAILVVFIVLKKLIEIYIEAKENNKNIKQEIMKHKKYFILPIILTSTILIFFISWKILAPKARVQVEDRLINNEKENVTVLDAIFSGFTGFIESKDEYFDFEMANRKFIYDLYLQPVFKEPLEIPIITYMFIAILLDIYIYKKLIPVKEKKKFLATAISLRIGLILYSIALEIAYIIQFGTREMMIHASLNRYLNSYLLAEFIWRLYIILDYFSREEKNQKIKYTILTILVLIITPIYSIAYATIFSSNFNIYKQLQLYPIEYRSSKLKEILPKDAKVYVVHQNCDRDASMFKLRYFIMPDININITEKLTQELENRYVLKGKDLKEEWLKILRNGYEYLYIIESDEYFEEFAKEEFISQINKNTLYKINKDENEKITIELMESL